MTPTHVLIAAAVLARRGTPVRNGAVIAGALLPDAAMFVFFGHGMLQQTPHSVLWDEHYWRPGWQAVFAIFNSFPLYLSLFLLATLAAKRWAWMGVLTAFSLAALLHLAADLPVHADDAHSHFWPFSDWRFHSPLSYWDPGHHGMWGSLIDAALGIGCAVVLARRFQPIWVKVLCGLACLPYLLGIGFAVVNLV